MSRLERMLCSGVRSSCPASAAKRRAATSACSRAAIVLSRRASIPSISPASAATSVGCPGHWTRTPRSSASLMRAVLRARTLSGRSARRVTKSVATSAIASPARVVQMTVVRKLAARAEIRSGAAASINRPAGPLTTALRHWCPAIVVVLTPARADIAGKPGGTLPRMRCSPVCGFRARTKAI